MEAYWDVVKRIITESDVVLEILDSRLVELSRNEKIEALVKEIGRPLLFVINKADLVSKEKIKEQVEKLREKGEVVFISAKKKDNAKILYYYIKKTFKEYGKRYVPVRGRFDPKPLYREARADIVVGLLGYPNVGKSSIINLLSHKKKVKVSKKSGTTHGIHWIKASNEMKLLDSPGVIPLEKEDEVRSGLIGARDNESLKNPELVAHAVINLFLKLNLKGLEEFYEIKIEKKDPAVIVDQIAEKKSYLLKKGMFDVNRATALIIRDWQQGKLRL